MTLLNRSECYDKNYVTVKKILERVFPTFSIRGIDPGWSLWRQTTAREPEIQEVGNEFMGQLAIFLGYEWAWEDGHSAPIQEISKGLKMQIKVNDELRKSFSSIIGLTAKNQKGLNVKKSTKKRGK